MVLWLSHWDTSSEINVTESRCRWLSNNRAVCRIWKLIWGSLGELGFRELLVSDYWDDQKGSPFLHRKQTEQKGPLRLGLVASTILLKHKATVYILNSRPRGVPNTTGEQPSFSSYYSKINSSTLVLLSRKLFQENIARIKHHPWRNSSWGSEHFSDFIYIKSTWGRGQAEV